VILDVEMPGMTGLQVLTSLRALDPTIPVIVLTANTDGSVAAETLKLGAVSYAPKPLNLKYLDHLVATFATKRARAQAPEEAGGRGMDRMRRPPNSYARSTASIRLAIRTTRRKSRPCDATTSRRD
jgi:DNA-binding NtrC family response regulator